MDSTRGLPSIVIDGYNLIHALGLLGGKARPGDVERSRSRLLERLHKGLKNRAAQVSVVFDTTRGGGALTTDEHGIRAVFAPADREADDLIEDMIQAAAVPRRLIVVSDDLRLRQAARRGHAVAMRCGEFLDWLEQPPARASRPPATDDEKTVSGSVNQDLLEEFKDLDDELRRFFYPFGPMKEGEERE